MSDVTMFTPETKSVKALFLDTDVRYSIPNYQRPYAWKKEQVEQLWYDILEAYQNNKSAPDSDLNYFLGSIVVVGKNDYEVVDGQQRLTTLTILFYVLQDLAKKSEIDLSEDQVSYISACLKDVHTKRQKLKTHIQNQVEFEEMFKEQIDYSNKSGFLALKNAIEFKRLILDIKTANLNLEDFVNYLLNNTKIIRISCTDVNSAIKLFSVLNARGMDLQLTDLIKADMMVALNDEEKRDEFNEVWKEIEKDCKDNDENFQELFKIYLHFCILKNTKSAFNEEFKAYFDKNGKKSNQMILDIRNFVKNLVQVKDENDPFIFMLKQCNTSYWKMILTTAKHIEYADYNELKALITKYYYQSWIAGGTENRIKQTSFNVLKVVKENNDISIVKQILLENLEKNKNQGNYYKNNLQATSVYEQKWCKPVLLALEYSYKESSNLAFIKNDKNLHSEHIFPQSWDREELNWKEKFSKADEDKLLNCLGNLTLLSYSKNISASNTNYSDKRKTYLGENKNDGVTTYEITRKLIEKYQTWTPETIKTRREEMIAEIEEILEIV